MPLHWDRSKCKDLPDKLDETDNSIITTLTYGTMFTGIPEITEKNYQEFYARIHMLELITGAFQIEYQEDKEPKPLFLEPKDIKRFIGLSANASQLTRRQFVAQKITKELDKFKKEAEKS